MSQQDSECILDTSVSWTDFEKNLRNAFSTDATLGPNRAALDIGEGNGYNSCCALITCDWVGAAPEEKLPKTVVLKMPSSAGLHRLNDSMPEEKKMFDYSEEDWEEMERSINKVHNREIAAYEFFEEFKCRTIPRKYFGNRVEDGNRATGQLCLEYIENSRMMSFHEKHSVEHARQIARALGQLQACSIKKEVTALVLQKDFFGNLANIFTFEAYNSTFKRILAIDNSKNTKVLMEKIDLLLPVYYGANIASTLQKQMGFRPVIVHADLHPPNVLIDKDTGDLTAIIDWQCTHLGVGVEDLHRIAISSLTAEDRRASTPMLVEEMYTSLMEHLDGAEPPYSLETLLFLSDLIYPHCALYYASFFIALIEEKNTQISEEERKMRQELKLAKIIGCLEDVVALDLKNKKQLGDLQFRYN